MKSDDVDGGRCVAFQHHDIMLAEGPVAAIGDHGFDKDRDNDEERQKLATKRKSDNDHWLARRSLGEGGTLNPEP